MVLEVGELVGLTSLLVELRAALPPNAHVRLASTRPKDIVLLVTREPHCLGDLLIRHAFGELNARILAVIGNHATLLVDGKRLELKAYSGDGSQELDSYVLQK